MKLAKVALVALALWMPSASGAAALLQTRAAAAGASRDEQAPDEAAGEAESDAVHAQAASVRLPAPAEGTRYDGERHRPLDGHLVEPLLPPPNAAA